MPANPPPEETPPSKPPGIPVGPDPEGPRHTPSAGAADQRGVTLGPGQRPLPDYELVRLLGRGGYSEVWLAKGPGGIGVALKFVRLEGEYGTLELRALELMKSIRHPHLLPMFGIWKRDGLLIVAMELADGTLLDRLRQAEGRGLPGIPPDELLEYMHEAAKGLDFLNDFRDPSGSGAGVGILHKDVKPQNLLLVGGAVKVADFGLACLLEHDVTEATGGLTPAYAAPEFFDDRVTRWSDQYSLAVTYCQLRGGQLPFGGTPVQVVAGHLSQSPDLTMLPAAERPVVARALSKDPEERWPSCRAFVQALQSVASSPVAADPTRTVMPLPVPPLEALLALVESLTDELHDIRDGVRKAIDIAERDPEMALTRVRKVLELVIRAVYQRRIAEPPGTRPLENLLQRLVKEGAFPKRLAAYASSVRELGNIGTHSFDEQVTTADVQQSLMQLVPIIQWYLKE
jgi:serine/threonine protein kinase